MISRLREDLHETPQPVARDVSEIFFGTPYENAPDGVRQQVIAGAQVRLTQRGYYRSGVDGLFGPGTENALRAYQSRFGLAPSGRFDEETLGALGLLPGQRARGFVPPPRRRYEAQPRVFSPAGERIYIPR